MFHPPRAHARCAALRRQLLGAAALLWAAFAPAAASAEGELAPKAAVKPGDPAPVFRLRALDGAMVRLDELAYTGKEKSYAKKRPVFIDFFRTDCKACIKAMPELVALHQKYAPRGVEFLLIALLESEDGRGKLERYLATQKLPFKILVDDNEHFAKKYLGNPVTLPATFLIDAEGTVKQSKYGSTGTYEGDFGEALSAALEAWKPGAQAK